MSLQSTVIPPEMFPNIIRYSMEGVVGDLDPNKPPLSYRLVSTGWKALVDKIPEIWAKLAVRSTQYLPGSDRVVARWIERTGTSSLSIILKMPTPPNNISLALVLMTLMPFSSRFEELDLDIPPDFFPVLLSNTSLARLTSLRLSMSHQPDFILDASAAFLENVSLIVPITTVPFVFNSGRHTLILPFAQVTRIELNTGLGAMDCIWMVLFQCTSLRALKICAEHNPFVPQIPLSPQFPWQSNLRSLTMSVNTRSHVVGLFLDGLRLPFLEELDISFWDPSIDPDLWPGDAIVALRKRSIAPLKQVTVRGKNICEAELVDFVTKMPTLEELAVAGHATNLLTPKVMALLPQTEEDIQRRRVAYDDELDNARRLGLRN
jgi:hypothetical protein